MIYTIFHPIPALTAIVEYYWYAKINLTSSIKQHYATPLLQGLAFNFKKQSEHHAYKDKILTLHKQAYLFGQPTCPREITTNENGVDILGVKFKPMGIVKITGMNMESLADQIVAAEDIWGSELEDLCDEMQSADTLEKSLTVLEKFLIDKYTRTSLHYRADNAENAIRLIHETKGTIDIKTLQTQTNTSRKTLERAFLHYLGLMPKFYAEVVRFNTTKHYLETMPECVLYELALNMGYYDTSHLAASFKRFSGLTPTRYINNVKATRIANTHFRENGSVSLS